MPLVPHRFLFRVSYPCRFVEAMPIEGGDTLVELSDSCRIDNFADMDERHNFADVRLGWNERGVGLTVEVHGKDLQPVGDPSRPRHSDGVTLWIDTRDARTSHRASRHCHQFHFLPNRSGPDQDEPVFVQARIHRATQDAPLAVAGDVPFQCLRRAGGYRIEAFLPAAVLNGFDPEQNRRLGFFYAVRDSEKGEQTLSVGIDFPYAEDPSLWNVLELVSEGN